ncbi:PREDICTED: waprin-Phi1-like [Papilio xuthus]|uniref:Waprin-Phi1-like n=1 Tax=Papilio xuthus TaxID=66420 RepID=A0AAJ6ZEU0_PAPXU|nr:PREDICTED: waprin-Phi1-like [Papilio xuthus]
MLRIYLIIFLVASVQCMDGSCPPTLPVAVCDAACGPQRPCEPTQLCCPTECGGSICVDPMTKRHFVNYVKEGKCPEQPRGTWSCSHTCTTDADCPRALKCCVNRCGALTCKMPSFPNVPLAT